MARIATDPNYSSPTFPRATAATDLFLKEDVQSLAAAVSTHDHTSGKGLPIAPAAGSIPGSAITDSTITSAKILDGTVGTADLAPSAVVEWAGNAAETFSGLGGSTTSASMVDIASAAITQTTYDTNTYVLVEVVLTAAMTAPGVMQFGLRKETGGYAYVTSATVTAVNQSIQISLLALYKPGAGAHTWQVGWAALTGGGTLSLVGAASFSMYVIQFKR